MLVCAIMSVRVCVCVGARACVCEHACVGCGLSV